jgi:biotin-(acetyl-CoA carboxylase) ligase
MSNSLDKLKALTSKLEEKLEQKQKQQFPPISQSPKEEDNTIGTHTHITTEGKTTLQKRISEEPQATAEKTDVRQENIGRLEKLYRQLKIDEKSPDFENIFIYKAMNLSGIGLKEEDFGEVREGKYIQVIAITYEPDKNGKKKAKNVSLGYFGKAEKLEEKLKNEIIEFVLRWRYEKAFQNVEHYKELIEKIGVPADTLF